MAFYDTISDTSNFVISFTTTPTKDFGVFARGYLHAASNVAEDLLLKGNFPDYDAYPVVFLYRHSLELYLKNIIYKSFLLSTFKYLNNIETRLYNDHKLIVLSQKATAMLQRLFPDDKDIERISEEILRISHDFSEIDRESFSYRYPMDVKGNSSTTRHQMVNLRAFHNTMKELLENLDIVDFGFSVETSKAQEIYEILQEYSEN